MRHRSKIRLLVSTSVVVIALLMTYGATTTVSELASWWLPLNIVPYLAAFGAEAMMGIPPDPTFYLGIGIQWALIGILIADLYTRYRRPPMS